MTKRAVLYARVSGDDRIYATSGIDSQLADCRNYADDKEYVVVDERCEMRDKRTSGAEWLPELDNILKSAKQGQLMSLSFVNLIGWPEIGSSNFQLKSSFNVWELQSNTLSVNLKIRLRGDY